MSGSIACIGGGGFTMDDTRLVQERWLLSLLPQARRARPRVLFLGTAGGDAVVSQLKAYKTFTRLGCDIASLPFFPYEMARDYAAEARAADLVFVGGGNTVAMLAVWREFGFDRALREAWEGGAVLAGISAGANCWFEHYVTDSVPGGGLRPGLGWLPGTFCPHLDSEPWRQPLLAAAPALPVFGAPEGVVIRFDGGAMTEIVTNRDAGAASVRLAGEPALRAAAARVLGQAAAPN
ncbi:MAG TPA: Type 1 glutamine amidotransferase-like domain-containing protein [Burkholderiaceae bacterium]|nr:Type 1 glutamine amidotransferase-like domain-containing protein [Burkholderiaceae bacterium]